MTNETPLRSRERYKELMNRAIGIGSIGIVATTVAAIFAPASIEDLLLFAGVGIYYLGILGYLAIWQRTGVRLFDEREAHIERRTSQIVVLILIFVTGFALPANVLFDVTGLVDVPAAISGAVWGYMALLIVMLVVYGYVANRTK